MSFDIDVCYNIKSLKWQYCETKLKQGMRPDLCGIVPRIRRRENLDGKDNKDFFSTESEYNKSHSDTDSKEILDSKYSKYLNTDETEVYYDSSDSQEESDFEDISSSEDGKKKRSKEGPFFKRNNYRNLKILLITLLALIVLSFGTVVAYLFHITKGADYSDEGIDYNEDADIVEEENLNLTAMGDVTDADSLNGFLYNWANNGGEKMHSKNVLNVLLCGIDSTDGTASGGRADAIMLVSINKKSKTITLSSFFRDSHTYMAIPTKSGGTKDRYEKLNASYVYGGPKALMDTIEKDYKIEIDQYIAVDFKSFTKLIDALGGVTVDVEQREAMYIRRTSSHKNFPYGQDVKLKGSEALVYTRIRKLDSDVNRTERQRKVIKALIDSAKTATTGQLVNAYKLTAQYIRTGYSQGDVMTLIATAVTQGWMKFNMVEFLPNEEGVNTVSATINTTGGRGQWVWIVDFPVCAQALQKTIYGESNIILKSDRVSALDFTNAKRNTSSGGSSSSSTPSYTGNSYSGNDDPEDTTRTKTTEYYDPNDEPEGTTEGNEEPIVSDPTQPQEPIETQAPPAEQEETPAED